MLKDLKFLYGDINSMVSLYYCLDWSYWPTFQPYHGLFHGELVWETLTAHFTTIEGAVKVPTLESKNNNPIGTIGMSAAAVSAFLIWQNYS